MLLTAVWMASSSVAAFFPLGGVKTHTLGPNWADAYVPHRDGGAARAVLAGAETPTRPPMTNPPATRADKRPHRPPRRAPPRAGDGTWILVIDACLL